jgi:molecular chaperone GrpE
MNSEGDIPDDPIAAAESGSAPAAPPPSELDAAEAELVRQRDDYLARWQRAAADYKNLRRRSADEVESAVRRTVLPLLTELLLVLDHLELALQAKVESADARALYDGVKLTRDQFLQVLQRHGVEAFESLEAFDPARHEAVATRADAASEPGTILELVRRGYTWRGQVLRHAHVIVSRLGTEAPGESPAES